MRRPSGFLAAAAFLLVCVAALADPFPSEPMRTDPESHDALELFSRLCIATRGDRARTTAIIGEDDGTVERLSDEHLQGPNGAGWIIRMPLGDKLLVEFLASGACVVRAPRVDSDTLEFGLKTLLESVASSGQFKVRPEGEDTKTIDKVKFHFVTYGLRLPDTGAIVEVGVATTDERKVSIQGTLSYVPLPAK